MWKLTEGPNLQDIPLHARDALNEEEDSEPGDTAEGRSAYSAVSER